MQPRRVPPMPSAPTTSRRDALRALAAGALALPVSACGTALGPPFGLPGPLQSPPIPVGPAPPVSAAPTEPAEVMPVEREARIRGIEAPRVVTLPPRIPRGGTIALVAPAGVLRSTGQLDEAVQAVEGLGFRTKVGRNVLNRFGFLAGTDQARARDFMTAVTDPEVDAVLAVRGGWGCARILPFLDWDAIAANPKPIVGYSDITALLLAVYARTGIATFHGPVGVSTWQGLTSGSFVRTLVEAEPVAVGPETRTNRDRTQAVRPGTVTGPVAGGNLSVIAALAGTGFLPDLADHVVFFEEVREDAYRVDRLLVQLELAGVMDEVAGIAFGQCSNCSSGGSSWSAEETIRRHLQVSNGPALMGAPIGHVSPVYTMPIGPSARLDADAGTLEYLGPAVA